MKILGIIGSGDLGQQIAHYALTDNHYNKVVFFDDFTNLKSINDCDILGTVADVKQAYQHKLFDELIIAIGYKFLKVKKDLYVKFSKFIPFGKVIHSSAWIDETAIVEPGCVIYPRCMLDAKTIIKANTILNLGCSISHDTTIGQHNFLSPCVVVAGFVVTDELCIIGINSTVIDNLTICAQTQIGGGAVVIKSIKKNGLYVGNPAKFKR